MVQQFSLLVSTTYDNLWGPRASDSTTTQSHSSSTSSCLDTKPLNKVSRFPLRTTPLGCEPHFLIELFQTWEWWELLLLGLANHPSNT